MRERGYGRILHVASIAGKEGNAGMAAYSASKAGLIGLVKVMGKEYAETGVTINALAPAVIRTPMVAAMPEAQVKYMTDKIPMKRCGELEEAAAMIGWIVSPECSFTTGFTFDMTGGRAVY
jgi:3-oxoacyl-[acyl-carrier protein] reductase